MNGVLIVSLNSGTLLFSKECTKGFGLNNVDTNPMNLGALMYAMFSSAENITPFCTSKIKMLGATEIGCDAPLALSKFAIGMNVIHFSKYLSSDVAILTILFAKQSLEDDIAVNMTNSIARDFVNLYSEKIRLSSNMGRCREFKLPFRLILLETIKLYLKFIVGSVKYQREPQWILLITFLHPLLETENEIINEKQKDQSQLEYRPPKVTEGVTSQRVIVTPFIKKKLRIRIAKSQTVPSQIQRKKPTNSWWKWRKKSEGIEEIKLPSLNERVESQGDVEMHVIPMDQEKTTLSFTEDFRNKLITLSHSIGRYPKRDDFFPMGTVNLNQVNFQMIKGRRFLVAYPVESLESPYSNKVGWSNQWSNIEQLVQLRR